MFLCYFLSKESKVTHAPGRIAATYGPAMTGERERAGGEETGKDGNRDRERGRKEKRKGKERGRNERHWGGRGARASARGERSDTAKPAPWAAQVVWLVT